METHVGKDSEGETRQQTSHKVNDKKKRSGKGDKGEKSERATKTKGTKGEQVADSMTPQTTTVKLSLLYKPGEYIPLWKRKLMQLRYCNGVYMGKRKTKRFFFQ